jgi:general secretion pathway protein I
MKPARGFTLLEVLLAFVILAAASGLLLGMLSGGLGQVARSRSATEASLYAQSLLDGVGVLEPVAPGERSGDFDGGRYHYRLQISEVPDPAPAPPDAPAPGPQQAGPGAPTLYRIALDVRWGERAGQQLHFATLRARAAAQLALGSQ